MQERVNKGKGREERREQSENKPGSQGEAMFNEITLGLLLNLLCFCEQKVLPVPSPWVTIAGVSTLFPFWSLYPLPLA